MTDKTIDLSRYEGRTPGEWEIIEDDEGLHTSGCTGITARYTHDREAMKKEAYANAALIADAPLLVAEVERLREKVANADTRVKLADGERHKAKAEVDANDKHIKELETDLEAHELVVQGQRKNIKNLKSQRDELAGALEACMAVIWNEFHVDQDQLAGEADKPYRQAEAALAKVREGTMTDEEAHILRHEKLHKNLDELVADYITHTKGLPSKSTILDLMRWAHEQTTNPNVREGTGGGDDG